MSDAREAAGLRRVAMAAPLRLVGGEANGGGAVSVAREAAGLRRVAMAAPLRLVGGEANEEERVD
ncbi:hypothetical protein [Streptomyces demainii]|uniref:Uncharacterized protein n=1 Tax=Streptomyces demainii TaxID=588122 RepID=A0ABT9KIN1_9ACTN|nr:hypothetical protein [Streptomyces demainii]MDP9608278.1 hypothetical protein [Streptomyces demainii]